MTASDPRASTPGPEPALRPRLHVVLLAHLDTQWRWTEKATVESFLPDTVRANEALFDRFPSYVLSFEGAYRYQLLAEHHPELFARVRARVAEGRWEPAGSALEAFDANLPAPESIVRQILYGRRWFERELGRAGCDLLLPDCFGFPASLPTIAAHCGVIGFSTQKLRKGATLRSAFGVPFHFGLWNGPDGSELLAVLDPGEYGVGPEEDLGDGEAQRARFAELDSAGRPARRMTYFGVGDQGGALPPAAVERIERSRRPDAAIEVAPGPSERIYLETTPAERKRLPGYRGDLLLHLHGSGCYTSRAGMKRWNRTNERLARAAEAAAALAALAGRAYPVERLERAWTRFLARQMHDDLTGTSIPAAYRLSWNDEAIAANELSEILLDALSTVAGTLDRRGTGWPLLLFNPLGGPVAELAAVALEPEERERCGVRGADGRPLPAQRGVGARGEPLLLFAAEVPATGATVVHVEPGLDPVAPGAPPAHADAATRTLANGRLTATFDAAGALARLVDRELGRDLLSAPLRLELLPDRSLRFPAWEIQWRDAGAPPRARVDRLRSLEVVESGPLRSALRVEREAAGSRIVETWRLAAGAAHLEAEVEIDWRTPGILFKAAFPLAAASAGFLCDLGVGVAERPLASERLWEVPAQRWTALRDEREGFGVALLSDVRAGWDHPDPRTLRLTLIHAPAVGRRFRHQATQDFGRHRFRWAIAGFPAEGLLAGAAGLADRFCAPPIALRLAAAAAEATASASNRSLVDLGPDGAALMAIKRSEEGDRTLLRLRETGGATRQVEIAVPSGARTVEEVDGLERHRDAQAAGDRPVRSLDDARSRLQVALRPWSLRTLALELPSAAASPDGFRPVELGGSSRGFTRQEEREAAGFDGRGVSFPLELVPARLESGVVPFDLAAPVATGAVRESDGGALDLPTGFAELWMLGASTQGDLDLDFDLGGAPLRGRFPDWRAPLARPDEPRRDWLLRRRIVPGGIRRVPLAWFATHLHDARGRDLAGERAFLFAVRLALAGRGGALRLPREPRLRLVAATLATKPARLVAESLPLFD